MLGLQLGDFRRMLDFVSPSFFDVVPARTLWSQARAMMASRRDEEAFVRQLRALGPVLERRDVGVRLVSDVDLGRAEPNPLPDLERGEAVLRLYFAQLAHLETAALDLRHKRFRGTSGGLQWSPRPLTVRWDPDFLRGIRDLYAGFYRDDRRVFEDAARRLNLTVALDLFIAHFGDGDQTEVRFDLEGFKQSFHSIFVRCKERGVVLPPGFIPLGAYLGALYEHLSQLDTPLNVRGAFEAVWTT